MKMRLFLIAALAVILVFRANAADDVVSAVHGTIERIDAATKTIVVKTSDGTRHVLRFGDKTAIHGARLSGQVSKDSWHGMTKGSEVIAHYTTRGAEDTAVEIDHIGHGGLKTTTGIAREVDRGGKTLVVDSEKGTKETFKLTGHAGEDAGKGVATGAKVAVYYTEDAGKKVAHFFE